MARGQVKSGGMNESMQLAEKVAAQLARHLTDVVLCPGSRNAPLSLALLARDDIRVHTRLDERGGAFTALGMARVQRRHVGVVMTSGTAVANTLPAVVEAHYSHTPLAIISADRPERLVGTGASHFARPHLRRRRARVSTEICRPRRGGRGLEQEHFGYRRR